MAKIKRKTMRRAADEPEMREEYDFSKGVRGKYASRFQSGLVVTVVLDPDVAEAFPDSTSVNEALRLIAKAGSRWSKPRRKKAG